MKREQNPVRTIPRRLSRRTMLRGAFGAGVALPFLDAMMPKSSKAQALAVPKRFGAFFSACGNIPETWTPTGNNPTTTTPTKTNPAISTNFTLSSVLAPLAAHQDKIVVLRGVSMESTQGKYGPIANVHDQGMTHMLTATPLVQGPGGAGRANHFVDGSAGGVSIDQHIAEAIGKTTFLPSLELGVESTDTFLELLVTQMSYTSKKQADGRRNVAAPPVDDPKQVYTRLFGTAQQGTAAQTLAALQNRQSVLDYARNDYLTLMNSVGASDRAQLDQYFSFLRDIESGIAGTIANPIGATCPGALTIMPTSPAKQLCLRDQLLRTPGELAMQTPNYCVTNFPLIGKLQLDLMILAYSCDLTRVASMQWSTAESTAVHSWLANPPYPYLSPLPAISFTGTQEHHMLTHNETVAVSAMNPIPTGPVNMNQVSAIRKDLSSIDTWYAMQYAYLIGQLKGIMQPDGTTLLDNTLLFWTSEVGLGGVHSYTNIPYVVAGGAPVGITGGRFIDFLGPTAYPPNANAVPFGVGPAHNKMFVSFLNKLGIAENTFGTTGLAGEAAQFTGPLPGL